MSSHRQALTVAPQRVEAQTAWGRFLSMQQRFHETEAALQPAITLEEERLFSAAHYAVASVEQTAQFLAVLCGLTWPQAPGVAYETLA